MATIALQTMHFFGTHGVHSWENQHGNDFEVDVQLKTSIWEAANTDNLDKTVDYTAIYALVKSVMESQTKLLEKLVCDIGQGIMKEFHDVESCVVRVSKLRPKVGGPCQSTWVEETFQ